MSEFLTASMLWIVFVVVMFAMHRHGCGNHGSHAHGRHGLHERPAGWERDDTLEADENCTRPAGAANKRRPVAWR